MRRVLAITSLAVLVGFSFVPLVASAATKYQMPGIWPTGYWGQAVNGNPAGLVSCTGLTCTSLCDLLQTIENILSFGESVVIFIATPVLFAWGGITIMIASGDPSRLQQGKKILTGTLIGLLITLTAYIIVATFVNFFNVGNYVQGFAGNPFNCVP
ncbi:MAG TPA: hypothetical protein VNG29_02860 [Candidatus Paceibacterota bacterium]|nr:hypothetical protein [Candidatus Paceibacterota bacterium]